MLDLRELGILKFNMRVLEEAMDTSVPPLERLKFLSVATSNLDEFFMVRIGKIRENAEISNENDEILSEVRKAAGEFYKKKKEVYGKVLETLSENNIRILSAEAYLGGKKERLERIFEKNIKPLLSVQIINASEPVLHFENKAVYCVARFGGKDKGKIGIITKSRELEKIVLTENKNYFEFVLVDDLIFKYADMLFSGMTVSEKCLFRLTRNADMNLLDRELLYIKDCKMRMKKILRKRKRLAPVRVEISNGISAELKKTIFRRNDDKIFIINKNPLSFEFVGELLRLIPENIKQTLSYPAFSSGLPAWYTHNADIFGRLDTEDLLLNYPYDSMKPFLRFLEQAAYDEAVESIKITLYRVNNNSRVVQSLIKASECGKEVIVFLELRARFDEENNINYSDLLEGNGVTVIYGPEKFKVHSKLCLVERIENGKIKYYTHIGTGNYNENTAKAYTDLNLLTADSTIGKDAALFFHNLLSDNFYCEYDELLVSPDGIEEKFAEKLEELEKSAENSRIIFKCNSLTSGKMIKKIKQIAKGGVKTDLIVRGACRLVPDTPELKENLRIVSIVGRFLEHSRIYAFFRGDESEIYISSADLMTRNLKRRIETAVLIKDKHLKKRIIDYLEKTLSDDVKARVMNEKAEYIKRENKTNFDSQKYFLEERKNED